MADEHKAWLDGATAEELLRGRAAGPAGPGADPRARAEAARLRAALDALTPPSADRELPGEAAALAAFRAAHATRAAAAVPEPAPTAAGRSGAPEEPLVDLAPIPVVRIPAQRRYGTPARFGLAAALAGVAVGGIAAVAGTGLLDRAVHLTAGPAPAVSVSADSDRTPAVETAGPTPVPQLRPTPEGGDGLASLAPGFSLPPDGRARTPLDSAPSLSLPPGAVTTPGTGGGGAAGTDGGTRNTFTDKNGGTQGGGDTGGKDRGGEDQDRPETLCRDHLANRLAEDREQHLAKIAGGLAKVPRFCATLLDAPRSGTPQSGTADQGGVVVPSPVLSPAGPLGFRTR
ncbi:hypothetical protein ACFWJT_11575 [Streptomyces sp. NPDC127069]|uniref:hypothetical protein n=1 Tax=Streptomyces sp. NPDC127069 TaxID=3347128 RepID=UPI00365BB401